MRILVSSALLVAVALTAGCSSAGGTSNDGGGAAANSARNVGQSLTLTEDEGSAAVTLVSITESYKGDGSDADSGNFVAAKLKFEAKSGTYTINPLYVMLKKADGKVVEQDDFAVPAKEQLAGDNHFDLSSGQTTEGVVAFDAPYDSTASIVVTDQMHRILGMWPVSGDKPIMGDGGKKRSVNKSATAKFDDASAVVTLVSVTESTGSLDEVTAPESGHLVIVELKFQGKSGEFPINPNYVKLKQPDGKLMDYSDGNGTSGVPSHEELDSDPVTAGKTVTGKVAFDTPLKPGSKIVVTGPLDKVVATFPL